MVEPPPIPEDEIERLDELKSLRILDTAAEERFDRYTRLVADLYDFPIVLITLVDKDRQWFKSSCGLDFRQTRRELSFCAHAIHENGVFVVPDARHDTRFARNSLVTGYPYIRFYAGATVRGPRGHALGTLCVIDTQPRHFDDDKCRQLNQFAALVEREIALTSELANLRTSLEFRARYDPLTHLPNSQLLREKIDAMIAAADSGTTPFAVVLFNVGGVRYINQAFGKSAGDDLLREVASRLERNMPAGGFAGRLGGDEFLVVLPSHGSGGSGPETDVARCREALERPYSADGREHYVNFRIGSSFHPEDGRSANTLIEKAASAIRTRESGSPATAARYNPSHAMQVSERLHMETRLRRALEDGNFRFDYQPIVSLADGHMRAVEALIRWDDDEVEDRSPARFIPLAERCGLILPIGEWAISEVLRQLNAWRALYDDWNVVATVNIAPAQLDQPGFARGVLDQLERNDIPPELAQVEVTEFSLVLDTDRVQSNLHTLNEAGVRSIIDDFGTGYCSMNYLRRMPVSTLKIDRSFISGAPADRYSSAITRTILAMAQGLELKTVAEGVERRDQITMLRRERCDFVQGFLLAKPMGPAEIPRHVGKPLH